MSTVIDPQPATPAAEAPKAKRGAKAKDQHPLLANDAKLDAIPEDWAKYATLKEDNFTGAAKPIFFRWQADRFEAKANDLRAKADRFERLGAFGDSKVAAAVDRNMEAILKNVRTLIEQDPTCVDKLDPKILMLIGMGQDEATTEAA